MDLPSFLAGLLPVLGVGYVCVVARRRRRRPRTPGGSPLVVNPYTLANEQDADARGSLPVVQPAPQMTTSQPFSSLPDARTGRGRGAPSRQERSLR